jgi:hypothetical protein
VTTEENPFVELYRDPNSPWGGHSGVGSHTYYTIEYKSFLEKFVHMNGITSIIDIGCGDWQFSQHINYSSVSYHGFDVVSSVIERNRTLFADKNIRFDPMPDDLTSLPDAQLVLMKDVLQHLPDKKVMEFKAKVFDRYPLSLLTNSYEKHATLRNVDISAGEFRCLDLTAPPYNFEGTYVLEFGSAVWERLRTLLYKGKALGYGARS